MSYHTYVDNVEIFGNNECFDEWIEFIKSQGIKVDEDGRYKGYITDINGALETIEKIIMRLDTYRINNNMKSLFNLDNIKENSLKDQSSLIFKSTLTDYLIDYIKSGYLFMPVQFIKACGNKIEQKLDKNRSNSYTIKSGKKIKVSAG